MTRVLTSDYIKQMNFLFDGLTDICFRDKYSYSFFKNLNNVRYAPDIVFNYECQSRIKNNNIVISVWGPLTRVDSFPQWTWANELWEPYEKFLIEIKRNRSILLFYFLNSIIDQANWNVDKYLLGRMIGSTAIAVYSVGAQINSVYIQVSDMTASVMATKVNLIVADKRNPLPELNTLFRKVGRIQAYVILAVISGFYVLGKDFILLWAGVDYQESYYVTLLLIVPAAIPLMQSLGGVIFKGH